MPGESSDIKDPFGLQRQNSDMFLAKDDNFNKVYFFIKREIINE